MFATLISTLVIAAPHFPAPDAFASASVGASRSLGLGAGVTRLFTDDATTPDVIGTLWLEGAWLADDWAQLFVAVPIGIGHVKVGAPTSSGEGLVLLTGGQVGARYLFMDALVRPFVGVQLTGLYVLASGANSQLLFGPGAHAGLELDAGHSISVRLHGAFDWFITLNAPQRLSVGATVMVATSF
ncbi:MAG: hypothetical protein Q8S33_27865 [Myxococcales bacterium]|nr:hypothetical protein [Myxococcales bacterium]MDP3504187.1 hypothetical protein [Myxococcales bacterium]